MEALREARGACVDLATSTRGVRKYSPPLAAACHRRTHPVGMNWRLDETDSRVKGAWRDGYGAVETLGVSHVTLVFRDCLQVLIQQAKIVYHTKFRDY